MSTMEEYFLEEKFCIICKDKAHRISFDPGFAAKNKWYTYYGTSVVEKAKSVDEKAKAMKSFRKR